MRQCAMLKLAFIICCRIRSSKSDFDFKIINQLGGYFNITSTTSCVYLFISFLFLLFIYLRLEEYVSRGSRLKELWNFARVDDCLINYYNFVQRWAWTVIIEIFIGRLLSSNNKTNLPYVCSLDWNVFDLKLNGAQLGEVIYSVGNGTQVTWTDRKKSVMNIQLCREGIVIKQGNVCVLRNIFLFSPVKGGLNG